MDYGEKPRIPLENFPPINYSKLRPVRKGIGVSSQLII